MERRVSLPFPRRGADQLLERAAERGFGFVADRGALAALAATLTDAQWRTPLARDGRPIGVVVHHVANMYPLEIQVAQTVASGKPIVGVTMDNVHDINAAHAKEFVNVTKAEALTLLEKNSKIAAEAIRMLTDEQLDTAQAVSLNDDAPLTCQFVLEDHAVRHSYHHLDRLRRAFGCSVLAFVRALFVWRRIEHRRTKERNARTEERQRALRVRRDPSICI